MVRNNLIDGDWIGSKEASENINPSDMTDVVGHYARAEEGVAAQAVEAASRAFTTWSQSSPQMRFDILDRAGSEILARKEELGRLLSREEGKTLREGIAEAARAGYIFKFMAGEALRNSGEVIDSVRSGIKVEITREPIGVVGIITPWNFPIAIPAWKIAPALAYGNTVVFKPADLVPGCAWEIADILMRSGLPRGVLNLVMGSGRSVGNAIVHHPTVAGISFTGSTAIGSSIVAAAATRGAKVQVEMGGKNPYLVLDDADIDIAVEAVANGSFFSTGQRCTASSRIIVTSGIHDQFVEALAARMQRLVIGHALDQGTDIGPVVDEKQLKQNLEYIEIGKTEGAKLLAGGERLSRQTEGYFLSPALFVETTNTMRINRDEIFGPVAAVQRVSSYDEALAIANDTSFGLSAGIATTSLKHAEHFKRHSRCGMVMVNIPTAGVDYHVPFGGTKASGYGPREQGSYAREFYTTVKTAYTG